MHSITLARWANSLDLASRRTANQNSRSAVISAKTLPTAWPTSRQPQAVMVVLKTAKTRPQENSSDISPSTPTKTATVDTLKLALTTRTNQSVMELMANTPQAAPELTME